MRAFTVLLAILVAAGCSQPPVVATTPSVGALLATASPEAPPPSRPPTPAPTYPPAARCPTTPSLTLAQGEGRNLCGFPVGLERGVAPARVSVDQSRAGDELTTSLTIYQIGPTGREERLWSGSSKMSLTPGGGDFIGDVSSFFPTPDGPAQVGYTVRHCGASCNATDVVVLAVVSGVITEVLRIMSDRATYEWDGNNLRISGPSYGKLDARCCPSATKVDVYRWSGSAYVLMSTTLLPNSKP